MEAYKQRVIEERDQLADRLDKLRDFLGGGLFLTLDGMEQGRMHRQAGFMKAYLDTLNERIDNFF